MLTQLSLEERPERFDDSSLDVLADPAERRLHIRRLSAWPGLAERHAEVEVGILVVVEHVSQWNLSERVAIFQRAEIDEVHEVEQVAVVGNPGACATTRCSVRCLSKLWRESRYLSAARSFRPYGCICSMRRRASGWTAPIRSSSSRVFGARRQKIGNSHLFLNALWERVARVRDREIEGQMVECAAEVEDTLADKGTPLD
jgi:hypothetical protein